jgi:hypothetical protein
MMLELENKVADLAARLERGENRSWKREGRHYTSLDSQRIQRPLHEKRNFRHAGRRSTDAFAVNIEDMERQILGKEFHQEYPFDGGTYLEGYRIPRYR